MSRLALSGATIVTPDAALDAHVVVVENGRIADIVASAPPGIEIMDLGGGWLLPGFIDTQVNGGGDVLFNDQPTPEGIAAIARAHRRFGTTGIMVTLISDDAPVLDRALSAVDAALADGMPGLLGIHVEGPFLAVAKRGIHNAAKLRRLDSAQIDRLCEPHRGIRMVTLAPEAVPAGAIAELTRRGILVSAGHSLANYDQVRAALDEGLRGFTHLFNAMTPLGSREPGMVGAALEDRASWFGLIVDGHHVHPATLKAAIGARGLEGAMLVTDAMPAVGGAVDQFDLMGTPIRLVDGTCRGPDGTLGGSALSMVEALRNSMDWLGCSIVEASRMASGNPAAFLELDGETGAIAPGLRADLVHLDAARRVTRSWINGDLSVIGEAALQPD